MKKAATHHSTQEFSLKKKETSNHTGQMLATLLLVLSEAAQLIQC